MKHLVEPAVCMNKQTMKRVEKRLRERHLGSERKGDDAHLFEDDCQIPLISEPGFSGDSIATQPISKEVFVNFIAKRLAMDNIKGKILCFACLIYKMLVIKGSTE